MNFSMPFYLTEFMFDFYYRECCFLFCVKNAFDNIYKCTFKSTKSMSQLRLEI